jgi:hypothetical protein
MESELGMLAPLGFVLLSLVRPIMESEQLQSALPVLGYSSLVRPIIGSKVATSMRVPLPAMFGSTYDGVRIGILDCYRCLY